MALEEVLRHHRTQHGAGHAAEEAGPEHAAETHAGPARGPHATPRALHRARLAQLRASGDPRERPRLVAGPPRRAALGVGHVGRQFLEEALALLAQPKERRGRGQAKPPLKDLGPDPGTGKPIVVKEGRFGPYVTDGETNASLRKGDDPEGLTMDRALELLAERRAKGPAPKKTRRVAGKR